MDQHSPQPALNPMSLTVAHLIPILTRVGGYAVTPAMIEADLAAGAPVNADGTINLIHYGAWLAREVDHAE